MSLVKIDFKFPKWSKTFKEKLPEIYAVMAASAQTNRALLFDSEGGYNGHTPWKPLKFRAGQPLRDKGRLKNSIGPLAKNGQPVKSPDGILKYGGSPDRPIVTIGTTLYYAALMNNGGIVRAKNGHALAIPMPLGKNLTKLGKEVSKKATHIKVLHARLDEMKKIHERTGSKLLAGKISRLEKLTKNRNKSQRFLFVKKVKIPARPFDTWNRLDQLNMERTLIAKLNQILNETKP
jgi:phage gpG-like protein